MCLYLRIQRGQEIRLVDGNDKASAADLFLLLLLRH
jgi:hypothetical protein